MDELIKQMWLQAEKNEEIVNKIIEKADSFDKEYKSLVKKQSSKDKPSKKKK